MCQSPGKYLVYLSPGITDFPLWQNPVTSLPERHTHSSFQQQELEERKQRKNKTDMQHLFAARVCTLPKHCIRPQLNGQRFISTSTSSLMHIRVPAEFRGRLTWHCLPTIHPQTARHSSYNARVWIWSHFEVAMPVIYKGIREYGREEGGFWDEAKHFHMDKKEEYLEKSH